jgi:hypothetical protein
MVAEPPKNMLACISADDFPLRWLGADFVF